MKYKILVILVFVLGCFLRLYKLGSLPNSYTPDEVAQGYTAYSILLTGKDEWGNNNLFRLQSFGDYKLPLQTIFMIPSIKILGLNPFAIRLPNALFSCLTLVFVYLLTHKLFSNKKISLLSLAFLAFSPWHLPISRIALEANLSTFFITFALFLFLYKPKSLFYTGFSALFFGLNLFTYHSAKIFSPLVFFLMIAYLFYIHKLKTKQVILPILIFSIFLFTALFTSFGTSSRASDIAIFNPTDKWTYLSNTQYEIAANGFSAPLDRFFNNKVTFTLRQFFDNYLSYFSPQFFVTSGAGETTYGMIPGFGVVGFIAVAGLIYSLFLVFSPKNDCRKLLIFLFTLVLISPLPGSLAKSYYSANRVAVMMPFVEILAAYGLYTFFTHFKKIKFIPVFVLLFFVYETLNFLIFYFYNGNNYLSDGMLYGRRQAVEYAESLPHHQVIFSRKLSEPQAYTLFFAKIDPSITQAVSPSWTEYSKKGLGFLDQLGEYNLLNYTFREINPPSDKILPDTLLIGKPEEFRDLKPDKIIYSPSHSDPKPVIYLYDTSLHHD